MQRRRGRVGGVQEEVTFNVYRGGSRFRGGDRVETGKQSVGRGMINVERTTDR